ncbi:hypothetical protein COLO4_32887 [Corchorus olitorius]|uniref:Uncharacterized protein n=1 Tax=Corchorus olitorius TaxID=93759 RepID=A0A1R3GXI9_9ROSI|nr:hypothetical protein COLO4_32887 [Corchorus olitorius]
MAMNSQALDCEVENHARLFVRRRKNNGGGQEVEEITPWETADSFTMCRKF